MKNLENIFHNFYKNKKLVKMFSTIFIKAENLEKPIRQLFEKENSQK